MNSLVERVGGEKVIEKVVDKLFEKILQDKRIKHFFKKASMEHLKKLLKHFLVAALGGANRYSGRNMRDAHY